MTASKRVPDPMAVESGSMNIEAEISGLADLDLDALKLRWRNLFGRAAPQTLPRALLAKVIACRRQAEVLGDIDLTTAQTLKRMAGGALGAAKPLLGGSGVSVAARPSLPPGTLLVREWKGELHRVAVMQEGFAWNGAVYASLSRVAREITGVNWNGFVFFGIAQKGLARKDPDRKVQAQKSQAPIDPLRNDLVRKAPARKRQPSHPERIAP